MIIIYFTFHVKNQRKYKKIHKNPPIYIGKYRFLKIYPLVYLVYIQPIVSIHFSYDHNGDDKSNVNVMNDDYDKSSRNSLN